MPELQWKCLQFNNLDNHKLYEILKFRVDVFVVEQNCAYPELDNKDYHKDTRHLFAYSGNKLLAYSRLLPPAMSYPEASIGRFAVDATARRQGIGTQLINISIDKINMFWPNNNIRISAQDYLQAFYERAGFKKVSDVYLEDGIPHIEMLKEIL